MSYNSIYTSVQEIENSARKLRRASSIFCSGMSIGTGIWTDSDDPIITVSGSCGVTGIGESAASAGDGFLVMHNPSNCAYIYIADAPSPIDHYINCDGMISLTYFETFDNNCLGATFNGCNNLSVVDITPSAGSEGMDALTLNVLYKSLPDRVGRAAGNIYIAGNTGTATHNSGIAINKNWIFG